MREEEEEDEMGCGEEKWRLCESGLFRESLLADRRVICVTDRQKQTSTRTPTKAHKHRKAHAHTHTNAEERTRTRRTFFLVS